MSEPFKITGPGRYRTRDGLEAVVLRRAGSLPGGVWVGEIFPCWKCMWDQDGLWDEGETNHDLVARVEDETEKIEVGDTVALTGNVVNDSHAWLREGDTGRVVEVRASTIPRLIGVSWDRGHDLGHSCNGRAATRHGWHVCADALRLVKKDGAGAGLAPARIPGGAAGESEGCPPPTPAPELSEGDRMVAFFFPPPKPRLDRNAKMPPRYEPCACCRGAAMNDPATAHIWWSGCPECFGTGIHGGRGDE